MRATSTLTVFEVSAIFAKHWQGVGGMFHKLEDGAWAINTNGFAVERLGVTAEEIEEYAKSHPRTQEGELKKFENMLLSEFEGNL